jgi:hypothetical protein
MLVLFVKRHSDLQENSDPVGTGSIRRKGKMRLILNKLKYK